MQMSKNKEEIKTEVLLGDYKGSPTITIYELEVGGGRKPYPFTFGKKKAQLIVKHIKEIEELAR